MPNPDLVKYDDLTEGQKELIEKLQLLEEEEDERFEKAERTPTSREQIEAALSGDL